MVYMLTLGVYIDGKCYIYSSTMDPMGVTMCKNLMMSYDVYNVMFLSLAATVATLSDVSRTRLKSWSFAPTSQRKRADMVLQRHESSHISVASSPLYSFVSLPYQ